MISFCGTFSCKSSASQKNTCHFLYNNSAMEGASIVCIKTRGFSPENPSLKMARRPFLRGFPPFASAHCRIRGNYGAPIPAVLEYATIASTGSFRKKLYSPSFPESVACSASEEAARSVFVFASVPDSPVKASIFPFSLSINCQALVITWL